MSFKFGLALAIAFVSVAGAVAEDERHAFETGGLRIVHPWARAAASGGETLVFMEIENAGEADVLLGGRTDAAEDVHVVGLSLAGADVSVQEVGEVPVPTGDFDLDPGGLALELHGLTQALEQGRHFDLTLLFRNAGEIEIEVAVEAAGASQHSHAGHSH